MKQYIVLMSMVALGAFIYLVIAGDGDSILGALGGVFERSAEMRTYSQ